MVATVPKPKLPNQGRRVEEVYGLEDVVALLEVDVCGKRQITVVVVLGIC